MLSGEEEQLLDIEPEQAAEELLARMLDARRYRAAAAHLGELLAGEHGVRFRAAPLPAHLRRTVLEPAEGSQSPELLGEAIGRLLSVPPSINLRHIATPRVSVAERLEHLRGLLARGSFSFDEAVRGADRMTVAVTLFALLELYKRGEAGWEQRAQLAQPLAALAVLGEEYAPGRRGVRLRELGGGWTLASDPSSEDAARRLLSRPRSATLTPAQAETLAIVAYLQPISRPEITRIRGVSADSASATLLERGLIEEAGSSQFGAVLYRTTTQFLKLFGLRSLQELPDIVRWDPTPEEQAELRERLLRAGEARAGGGSAES
jgi:segregation and condensation protein B